MALQRKVVNYGDITEYSVFGWEVDGNTPEGAVILKRDDDDPRIKQCINLELRYDSIKAKMKRLQMPEYPATNGKLCSPGIWALLLFWPAGLFRLLDKPGKTKHEQDIKVYDKQLREDQDELEEMRMIVQYTG